MSNYFNVSFKVVMYMLGCLLGQFLIVFYKIILKEIRLPKIDLSFPMDFLGV